MSKVVLSILVNNTSGVLSRVAGLFSRRGYNIDSLTVGETENPKYSRMTVAVTGDDIVLDQIKKQVNKLEDVKSVKELAGEHSVYRELVLVKVRATKDDLQIINSIADIFRGKIDDISNDSMIIETGAVAKMAQLLGSLQLSGGFVTMFIFCAFACFMSEMSSNTGAASICIPARTPRSPRSGTWTKASTSKETRRPAP